MNYRRLLTEITPPVLWRITYSFWRRWRGLGWHTYHGSWPTFGDVPVTSGAGQELDDPWAETLPPNWRDNLDKPRIASIDIAPMLLPVIACGLSEPISVIDFAGGMAAGLASLLRYVPAVRCRRYVLIETPAMCAALRDGIDARQGCSVSETIPEAMPHPLIVNAVSAIQYARDWQSVLSQLTALRPEFFIVAHTPLTNNETYARQVLETPSRKIAQWVFNRAHFVENMRTRGYRLVFAVDHDDPVDHGHAPGPSVVSSLVFVPSSRQAVTPNSH
jgi:putative methyltransferase (TIGR04325 family)